MRHNSLPRLCPTFLTLKSLLGNLLPELQPNGTSTLSGAEFKPQGQFLGDKRPDLLTGFKEQQMTYMNFEGRTITPYELYNIFYSSIINTEKFCITISLKLKYCKLNK
jgi:hypothetical protein